MIAKFVNTEMVADFYRDGDIKALAFFIKAKMLWGNSTIYKQNISLRKLANRFGCSHIVVKKYIDILKSIELIREINGNITFVSLSKTQYKTNLKNRTKILLNKEDSLSAISTRLLFSILKRSGEDQSYLIYLKKKLKTAKAIVNRADKNYETISKKEYKRLLALGETSKSTITAKIQFPTNKIKKQLNCTKQNLTHLKRKFQELSLCKVERNFKLIGKVDKKQFKNNSDLFGANCFQTKTGFVWKVLPSTVKFLPLSGFDK